MPQTVSIKLFLLKHHISYLENLYLQLPFPPHRTNQRLSGNDTNIRNIPSSTLVAPGYTPHLRFHQLEERNGKRKYGIEIEQKEEQNTHFELNATRFEIFFFLLLLPFHYNLKFIRTGTNLKKKFNLFSLLGHKGKFVLQKTFIKLQ